MARAWLILYVVVSLCGYYVYKEPIPAGSSEPIKLKILLAVNRLVENCLRLLERFGLVEYLHAKRHVAELNSFYTRTTLDGVKTVDTTLAGVAVRIYTPSRPSGRGMVYYHGGGWTIGSVVTHDPVTTIFSDQADMVVVSVGYRLTPEYSQRDGLDDCVAVTKHFIEHADSFGVAPKRIIVAGDSAGGNYAAAVSMVLRDDRFQPMPKLQLLIYPVTQAIDLMLPSYQQNGDGPFLTGSGMHFFLSSTTAKDQSHVPYLETNTHVSSDVRVAMARDELNHDKIRQDNKYPSYTKPNYESGNSEIWETIKTQLLDPYHYPLMSDDLSGLPEAYVFTGQYDVLRDEGHLYVNRLRAAGVMVTHYNSPVGWHAMVRMAFRLTDSMNAMKRMSRFVEKNV